MVRCVLYGEKYGRFSSNSLIVDGSDISCMWSRDIQKEVICIKWQFIVVGTHCSPLNIWIITLILVKCVMVRMYNNGEDTLGEYHCGSKYNPREDHLYGQKQRGYDKEPIFCKEYMDPIPLF